nr:MAG TPA: hypothetical protein [Caudoviricetes sp.]
MRAGGHFTALSFFGGNRCNEPLKLFFVKRQSGVAVFFVYVKRGVEKWEGSDGWKRSK